MTLSEFNLDFLALIIQFAVNFVLLVGLGVYLGCSYSWDSNTQQEEEAARQERALRATLNKRQRDNEMVHESLLPAQEDNSLTGGFPGSHTLDISAIPTHLSRDQGNNVNNTR